jgi:hypothetical protein
LPEIVALNVADGLPAYLEWIISGTIDEDGLRNDDDR